MNTSSSAPSILFISGNFEDEALTLRVMRKYHISNLVEIAHDGEEGLKILAEHPPGRKRPELVLLDFQQPRRTAFDLAHQMRALRGMEQAPFIICCASPEEERQVKEAGLARVACMSKPIGFFKLLECIQKLEMHWLVFSQQP